MVKEERTHTHPPPHTHTHTTRTHAKTHTHTHTYTRTHTKTHTHTHIHTHTRTHTHTHKHSHTHTHTNTPLNTHAHTCVFLVLRQAVYHCSGERLSESFPHTLDSTREVLLLALKSEKLKHTQSIHKVHIRYKYKILIKIHSIK
jgi:hypothetical protein